MAMAKAKFQLPKFATDKKVLAGVAAAAIVVIGGAAVMAGGSANAKTGKYTFETVTVERGDVSRVISASGAVQPREKVDVGSEVSGKITAIYVNFNDLVKKDQVLAQVDPETFENTLNQNLARLEQSKASRDNNRAAIDRAQLTLDTQTKAFNRTKALYAEGAASTQQMEQAEQAYKNAVLGLEDAKVSLKSSEAGMLTAEATVQDSRTRLDRTRIRSPIDGVILSRKVEVGQTVQSSQSVAQFFVVAADLSQIEIEASVVESDIGGIDNGDEVRFTVDAFPGDRFNGRVVEVRKLGAEQANVVTYTVVVNANNPNGKLLPGMTANVEITADRATGVLRIAEGATKFQPPKEIMDALCANAGQGRQGPPVPGCQQRNGQGGQGGGGNFGPGGGQSGPGGAPNAGQGGGQQMAGANRGGEGGNRGGPNAGGNPNGGNRGPGGNPNGGGNRGPGGGANGGFGGGGNQMAEWLTAAGVDEARSMKIQTEMQEEMNRLRASMMPQQPQGGGSPFGGQQFGPPPGMQQQALQNEMRAKMQTMQDTILKRNLSEEEYAEVAKHRAEMQNQRPVFAYKLNDKGELEPHRIMIGLSDGSYAQILRNAEEGDRFVIRANATNTKDKK
jgi:HlyD family secretion protein